MRVVPARAVVSRERVRTANWAPQATVFTRSIEHAGTCTGAVDLGRAEPPADLGGGTAIVSLPGPERRAYIHCRLLKLSVLVAGLAAIG